MRPCYCLWRLVAAGWLCQSCVLVAAWSGPLCLLPRSHFHARFRTLYTGSRGHAVRHSCACPIPAPPCTDSLVLCVCASILQPRKAIRSRPLVHGWFIVDGSFPRFPLPMLSILRLDRRYRASKEVSRSLRQLPSAAVSLSYPRRTYARRFVCARSSHCVEFPEQWDRQVGWCS